MLTQSPDKLLLLILAFALLLVVSINVYTLLHLLFRVDAAQRDTTRMDGPTEPALETGSDTAWLEGIDGLFGLVDPNRLGEAGAHLDQSAALLEGLEAARDEELSDWRAAHQQRIGSLLTDHRHLHQKLLQSRDALVQARATIATLRNQTPHAAIVAAQITSLKALNARQEQTICQLTADRTRYQWDLRTAEQQHEERIAAEAATREALEHSNAELARELAALRESSAMLEKDNAGLRATHERVMREKLFIEEALIKLDESASAAPQGAQTEDATPPDIIDKETT